MREPSPLGSTPIHGLTGIRTVTTNESHPAFHADRRGHVDHFTGRSPAEAIDDARAFEAVSWLAVERICALSQDRTGLVMDWWLLPPQEVAALGSGVDALSIEIDPDALERRERERLVLQGVG